MKTIGLIGGMSWESSDLYYQLINRMIRERLGGLASAKVLMASLNFKEVEEHQRVGNWLMAANLILEGAKNLERGGADCILICSVTGHESFDYIKKQVSIPMIHIASAINTELTGIIKVGVLGTIYTMEKPYFKKKLKPSVIVPNQSDREFISKVIYDEISQGVLLIQSKQRYLSIIDKLISRGAKGVILGCTEIPLLIDQKDCLVPIFDSVKLHCKSAVDFALGG